MKVDMRNSTISTKTYWLKEERIKKTLLYEFVQERFLIKTYRFTVAVSVKHTRHITRIFSVILLFKAYCDKKSARCAAVACAAFMGAAHVNEIHRGSTKYKHCFEIIFVGDFF